MPLSRYQIRNEYSLADPDLYRSADRDDPEALLEGVAMAGLVGVLRQLGDLAEFAAEIFHDLHEEVMATAARGHSLIGRVQQLEAEFPSVERRLLSQMSHTSFLYNPGFDWHPNLHMDENVITRGDLPRFVMDSYEECRGPPRLFLLDKFDVAGAGACLKRYTDPSFLKVDSASSMITKSEGRREKRTRKVKRRGVRGRYGETPDNPSSHAKLHQLLLEERIENSVNDLECRVRLKKRQVDASRYDGTAGKSYMDKFLRASSPLNKEGVSVNPLPLSWRSKDATGTRLEIVDISTVSPCHARETMQADEMKCSPSREEEVVKSSVYDELNEVTDKDTTEDSHITYKSKGEKIPPICGKRVNNDELVVEADRKSESTIDRYHSDDIASEIDNYMDALAVMESEVEMDTDSRAKRDQWYSNRISVNSDGSEEREQPTASLDTQSVGNSTMSEDGNNSLKEGHSFSCSDSASNFSVRDPGGNRVATEIYTVASLTDHGDTNSDQLSISEEIPKSDTQEYALGGSEVYCAKVDEPSGCSCHAGMNSPVHASAGDNMKENVVYSPGAAEAVSEEADERVLSRSADVSCGRPFSDFVSKAREYHVSSQGYDVDEMVGGDSADVLPPSVDVSCGKPLSDHVSEARKNDCPAEGYDVDEMIGDDSAKPSNGLHYQKKSFHSSEDDSQPEISDASGDAGSACAQYAEDGSFPILTDGMLSSSHSLNSPAEVKNQNLALSSVEACSDAARVQHQSIVPFSEDGHLESSHASADAGSGCAEYKKDNSLPILGDKKLFPSNSLNSPAKEKNQNLAPSSVEACPDTGLVHQKSMLQHEDRMKPDDRLADDYRLNPCARDSFESLSPPLDQTLSGSVGGQCTEMSHSGLVGQPVSAKEPVLFSAEEQSIRSVSTGADIEAVTSVSPLSDNSEIGCLETDPSLKGLGLDSMEHYESHGNGLAVDGFDEVCAGQVVNGDSASLLDSYQLDEGENITPENDTNIGDKSGSVCANEIEHDISVNTTECGHVGLWNVPYCLDRAQPTSVLQADCIPVCDHNHDNGGKKDDASSLEFTSKYSSNTVYLSVSDSNPIAEENNIEEERQTVPPSSRSDCLPHSPTEMEKESLIRDEDFAPKGVKIQELPPLHDKDLVTGEVASHMVDTHRNSASIECTVASKDHSGLRSLKDGSVSSLVQENPTSLQDNSEIADSMSPDISSQILETSFSEIIHDTENRKDADRFCHPEQMQSTQQINDRVHSTPGSAPSAGRISVSEIFPGSSECELNINEPQVDPLTSVLACSTDETQSAQGHPECLKADTDQSMATTSLLDIAPKATQINVGEAPPLPPLPPMQWRLGKVQHTSLVSGGKMMQHPFGSAEATSLLPTDQTELASQTSRWEESQYVNPFAASSIVENANVQLASQASMGWKSQYVNPILTYSAVDDANVPAVSGSSGVQPRLQDPLVLSVPPPIVHLENTPELAERPDSLLCLSSENGLQSPEIEINQPALKPTEIEDLASSHTSASTEEKVIPQEASISDEQRNHVTLVVDQETSSPLAPIEPTGTMLYEEHIPGGFTVSEGNRGWSSYPSDAFEAGYFNGTVQKKLPRPRNPLIDAVVALDKSKLRKVGERIKQQDVPKAEEGDILNHVQLRKVGERAKPRDAPKPEEADIRNHVQLRKVGERVRPQDVSKPEGDLRSHVQLRKVEEIVKPQDLPKAEQGDSLSHVQLRKVGEGGDPQNEPKTEESRDPLLLRKAEEADKPQDEPKPDDRDSLLEQIRNKTFHLKPAAVARPSIPGPKTNLKVAAILEKASNIRQAMAGSDEDDSDGWSDS